MEFGEKRVEFEEALMKLSIAERLAQVEQLLIDMMDYTEQRDEEDFYVAAYAAFI